MPVSVTAAVQPRLSPHTEVFESEPDTYLVLNKATRYPYEFGPDEVFLLQLMDGRHTPEEIRREYEREFGRSLRAQHLDEFLNQLSALGLIETDDRTASPSAAAPLPPSDDTASKIALNRRFDALAVVLGWLFHPFWIAPVTLLFVVAAVGGWQHSARATYQLRWFTSEYPLALFAIAVAVNVLFVSITREVLVGTACREYGGWVQGLKFHLLRRTIPFVFCDIGDSLVLMDRRSRWTLLTLRLWIHLALGSLATLAWIMAPPDSSLSVVLLVVALTSTVGLFLRSNICARTDGYTILAYLLGRRDLQEWALAETRAWLSFGVSPKPCSDRERFWIRAYGFSVYALRWVIVPIFLAYALWLLLSRLHGSGMVIALGLAIWWFQDSIRRNLMKLNWLARWIPDGYRRWMRWPIRLVIVGIIVLCGFIPYNYEVGGDCRLAPVRQYGVRAQISDEIVEMHVSEGDWVSPGDPIAILAVRDERAAVATTRAEIERAVAELELLRAGPLDEEIHIAEQSMERWRSQSLFWGAEVARIEALKRDSVASQQMLDRAKTSQDEADRSLQASIEYLTRVKRGARDEEIRAAEADVARLRALLVHHQEMLALGTITAPVRGRVITPNVQERIGQTVAPGDLIVVIHDTSTLLGEVAAEESAAPQIREGMKVKMRLRGIDGRLLTGKVSYLSRTAVEDNEFEVERVRSDREAQLQQPARRDEERRVRIYVELEDYDENLVAGMTGYARIIVHSDILWRAIARPVLRFLRVEMWSWLP